MLMNSNEYLNIVESIKQDIRTAQYRATVSVNRELLVLYHSIGEVINEHKTWGNKFVENLATDIKMSFPDRLLGEKPEIHGEVRTAFSRKGNCASGACTNYLVSPYCPDGQGEECR